MPAGHFTFVGCDKSKQKHAFCANGPQEHNFPLLPCCGLLFFTLGKLHISVKGSLRKIETATSLFEGKAHGQLCLKLRFT